MDKEEIELKKLQMLRDAMSVLEDDEPLEWEQELREGAWLILHNRPGMDREEWVREILQQYPTEVVDTFGPEAEQADACLAEWWEQEAYEDESTGVNATYREWALIFANDKSVMIYDEFASLNVKLKRLGLMNKLR